jgi:hypothetical protein
MDANWALVVLTGVLIIVTGYYAWQNKRLVGQMQTQNEVAKENLRVLNYDRRAAILKAVKKLAATALQVGDLPFEVVNRFAADVSSAHDLLDAPEASIIEEMIARSIQVSTRGEALRQLIEGPKKNEMRDQQVDDLRWLDDKAKELTDRFEKYLKLVRPLSYPDF